MNELINKILNCMESEIIKNYKPRIPEQNETSEQAINADNFHEIEFFTAESFRLGFLLGLEIAEIKNSQ